MYVVLAGIVAVTAVTVVAVFRYDDAAMIVTALGPVVGVIGTLVGAYFGLRGSSLAQQHANAARQQEPSTVVPVVETPANGRAKTTVRTR
jgi:hypothetical protein